jgi:hypothetical protein
MVSRPWTRCVSDGVSESWLPTSRVWPKSARQALSSSVMRIFFYIYKISDVVGNDCKKQYPSKIAVCEIYAVEVLKTTRGVR